MGRRGGFTIKTWHIAVLIGLFILWQMGYFDQLFTDLQTQVTSAEEKIYYGNLKITIAESNWFDGGSETTSNAVYTFWHGSTGYKGVTGTSISASGTTVEVTKDDQGWIYMRLHAGDSHFIAWWVLQDANPRIKDVWWEDIDEDGDNDLMVKIWVGDIGERGQASTPVLALNLPLIDEDVTGLTDDDPSDISSIGTSEVVKQITWKISGCSEKAGFAIARIYFVTNSSTGGDDVKFEELTLSGLGIEKSWDNPEEEQDNNYYAYYYKPADYKEVSNAIMAYRGISKADALYVTVNVRCTFESGDAVQVTLKMDILDTDGAVATTISDSVVLSA